MDTPITPNDQPTEGSTSMSAPDSEVQSVTSIINRKEPPKMKKPYIFETLIGLGDGETVWAQVVTNKPGRTEEELYNRLMELREDNHYIAAEIKLKREKGRKFRIKSISDTQRFHMLQGRAIRYGYSYRLEYIKIKERDEFGRVNDLMTDQQKDLLKERIRSASRSWSSSVSTYLVFLQKDGKIVKPEDFDTALGLYSLNSRKQSKRENENARITELAIDLSEEHVEIQEYDEYYDDPEDTNFIGVDGHYTISETYFFKIVGRIWDKVRRTQILRAYDKGEMTSFNARVLYDKGDPGLIKGDCHVVPNKQLEAKYGYVPDIVTHTCNIKHEKGTSDNSVSITLNPYHPHHNPNVSTQLLSWGLGFFATQERLTADFDAMVAEFVSSVAAGKFPKHLMNAAPPHNDDEEFNISGYINALHDATQRWLAAGLTLTHSSHLVKQHAGGFELKTNKAIRDLRMPYPWGTMSHCVTVEILKMGNWDLSEYDTTKMFWHAPTGRMCWPTQDFIDNYHRHGGHDQDDAHTTGLRVKKVDSGDNPNFTWTTSSGTTWCVKALNTRSPNGLSYFGENELPGEYSVLDIDLGLKIVNFGFIDLPVMNFPLYNVWDAIPVLDMSKAPQITHIQEIESTDLPRDDYERDEDNYTPEDAVRQFDLAVANPGIGQIINPMIAYAAIFETYPKWLPAYLEQMVDALEQTPDFEAFKKVLEAKGQILIAIQYHTQRLVDFYIAKRRVPQKVYEVLESQGRITRDTPYTTMIEHMKGVLKQAMEIMVGTRGKVADPKLKKLGINISQRRIFTPLLDVEVSHEAKVAAYDLIRYYEATRKDAPKPRNKKDAATGIMFKEKDPYIGYAARVFFMGLNDECVKRITEHEVNTREFITALYQVIINDGKEDDILFQTSEVGTLNGVMDMFMKVLWEHGIIDEILDPENIDDMGILG